MSRKELFKRINALCEELNEKYYINCGGCCFVAYCLAEQLEIYNIPYTIIRYGRNKHYSIKVSDRYLNRDYYRKEEIRDYLTTWNSKDLLDYYHNNYWNRSYETKYNGCVKKYIKAVFDKYGNNRT